MIHDYKYKYSKQKKIIGETISGQQRAYAYIWMPTFTMFLIQFINFNWADYRTYQNRTEQTSCLFSSIHI